MNGVYIHNHNNDCGNDHNGCNAACATSTNNPTVDTVDTVVDCTEIDSSTNFKSRVESTFRPPLKLLITRGLSVLDNVSERL